MGSVAHVSQKHESHNGAEHKMAEILFILNFLLDFDDELHLFSPMGLRYAFINHLIYILGKMSYCVYAGIYRECYFFIWWCAM